MYLRLHRPEVTTRHDDITPAARSNNPRPVLPLVAILCGGRGTRLQEHTQSIPKPLVEIGGRPILWHVMQIYLAQGFRRFVLLTGYKADLIEAFAGAEPWPEGADVRCIDTGLETPTGGRLAQRGVGDRQRALCA